MSDERLDHAQLAAAAVARRLDVRQARCARPADLARVVGLERAGVVAAGLHLRHRQTAAGHQRAIAAAVVQRVGRGDHVPQALVAVDPLRQAMPLWY